MIFSFSRLDLYEKCPYRWYQKYILNRDEVTKPLALGKAVHKAIELRIGGTEYEDCIMGGFIEADFHPEVTRVEIETLMNRAPLVNGEVELHFELPLAAYSSAPRIQGYIDLIQQNHFIDWKTNWQPYKANDTMQLRLYAWALMQLKGWETIKGSLYFLRYRRTESYVYTLSEADQARSWALDLAKEINKKLFAIDLFPELTDQLFEPNPAAHCKHCPFAQECIAKFPRVV